MDKAMTKIHNKMKARIKKDKNTNNKDKMKTAYNQLRLVISQYAKSYPVNMRNLLGVMSRIFGSDNLEFHFNKNDKNTLSTLVDGVPMQRAEQYYKNNPSYVVTFNGGIKDVPDNDDYFLINLVVGFKIRSVKITMKELANKELDKYMY